MPHYIVGRTNRDRWGIPVLMYRKNPPGKYQPHYGAKESAKFCAKHPI